MFVFNLIPEQRFISVADNMDESKILFIIVASIAQSNAREGEQLTRNKHAAHDRAWPKIPRLLLLAWNLHISPWLLNYRACFQLSRGGPWDIYSWLRTGLDRGGDFQSKSGHGSLFFLNYLGNCLKSNKMEWSQSHLPTVLLPLNNAFLF